MAKSLLYMIGATRVELATTGSQEMLINYC
jgi:hypothetical protein